MPENSHMNGSVDDGSRNPSALPATFQVCKKHFLYPRIHFPSNYLPTVSVLHFMFNFHFKLVSETFVRLRPR